MPKKSYVVNKTNMSLKEQGTNRKWPQYVAAGIATLSALTIGTHLSWSSSAVSILQQPNSILPIDDYEASWLGSIIPLGACAGAIPAGFIIHLMGSKRTLQIMAVPLLFTWYMLAFSTQLWVFYLARFLAGIGVGATCVAAPLYVTEVAEPRIRGMLGTFFQLQMTIGFLVGYVFGATISSIKHIALASSAFPLIFLLTFWFMPQSPVFLASKNRIHEAKKALQYLRGHHCDTEEELQSIKANIEAISENKCKFSDFYKKKATLKAMVIALALMFFQQVSGINAVLFYASPIFALSRTTLSGNVCAVIVGVMQVIATCCATVLIERLGRKFLLLISGSVMALCLSILAAYFHLQMLQYDVSNFYFVPLVCVCVYLMAFAVGLGPIPWMIAGDIFPMKVKGIACSVSTTFNWILCFGVTNLFMPLRDQIGIGLTFAIFGVVCVLSCVFTIIYIPETKGKSLEEVQALLSGTKNISTNNLEDDATNA